jgi:hypothetical protein
MTAGAGLSVRERERESGTRVSGRCWAALLGRARERARGRVAGPLGWAGPEGEKEIGPIRFLFFFFKILNSNAICLFH